MDVILLIRNAYSLGNLSLSHSQKDYNSELTQNHEKTNRKGHKEHKEKKVSGVIA